MFCEQTETLDPDNMTFYKNQLDHVIWCDDCSSGFVIMLAFIDVSSLQNSMLVHTCTLQYNISC